MVPCLSASAPSSTVAFVPMAVMNSACTFVVGNGFGAQGMSFRQTALSHRTLSTRSNSAIRAVSELTVQQSVSGGGTKLPRVSKAINMVDPLEAKRLAAEEWKELQSRSKFKRQRQIEATNGGWAMLGLTAGLVIEGYTGKGMVLQISDYLDTLADFLSQFLPSTTV